MCTIKFLTCLVVSYEVLLPGDSWSLNIGLLCIWIKKQKLSTSDILGSHRNSLQTQAEKNFVWEVVELLNIGVYHSYLYIHCVSKKRPTFKLSLTLSNLNRFSKFLHCWKAMKFAIKVIWQYPPCLRHVATLPWEIKHSNFLQIFSRYGRKCKQIAFWVHRF